MWGLYLSPQASDRRHLHAKYIGLYSHITDLCVQVVYRLLCIQPHCCLCLLDIAGQLQLAAYCNSGLLTLHGEFTLTAIAAWRGAPVFTNLLDVYCDGKAEHAEHACTPICV